MYAYLLLKKTAWLKMEGFIIQLLVKMILSCTHRCKFAFDFICTMYIAVVIVFNKSDL